MAWNPSHYLAFAGQRLRPALDLMARVPQGAPRAIVDLGCGTGNVTRLLAERWPDARVTGVDNSPAMLAEARAAAAGDPRCAFVAADLAAWQPDAPADLVFSNAALHWLPGHATLFPRVAAMVAAGGVLAVQMPDNFRAPSHTLVDEVAREGPWHARLAPLLRAPPVAAPDDYFAWLAPHASSVDVWRTEYLQVLEPRADGEHPVAAWTRGTWLVPLLDALDAADRDAFLREYGARLAVAYPPRTDGRVLFPFRRLFVVAMR